MKLPVLAILLISTVLPAQTAVARSAPDTASPAPRVTLLMSVLDVAGNPVSDLTKEQFNIIDNGEPTPVLAMRRVSDAPLDLGIVLYASKAFFPQEQAAAVALVQQIIRPNVDGAFVVTAGGSKPWAATQINWQTDKDSITKTIQSLDKDAGIRDAFNFEISEDDGNSSRFWRAAVQRDQGPTIFDAVWGLMRSNPRPSRRAVIIFREPWANSPGGDKQSAEYVSAKLAEIIRTAQQLKTPIYTIGIEDQGLMPGQDKNFAHIYVPLNAGAGASLRSYDENTQKYRTSLYNGGKANIEQLSENTGGRAFWDVKKNFPDAVAGIARALAGQYIFSFTAPAGRPVSPAHSLKVVPTRSGVHLDVATTYFPSQKQ